MVRFESVNYRATVWLNGRQIGTNAGAYLPFEFVLKGLRAARHEPPRGARRLAPAAIRTSRPTGQTSTGVPSGGWWNYGGIIREVYLRRVDTADFAAGGRAPRARLRPLRRAGGDDRADAQRHRRARSASP